MCSFILSLIPSPVFDYMHGGERPGEGNILGRGMSWGGEHPGEGHVLGRGMSWGGACPGEGMEEGEAYFVV